MKVLLLSDAGSVHTQKWVQGLAAAGVEVALFSLTSVEFPLLRSAYSGVALNCRNYMVRSESAFHKISYLKEVPKIRSLIKSFRPDIVHAHYASSYGLLGALANPAKYCISLWGSDVYAYPKANFAYKALLKYALAKADAVCSTSIDMARECERYYSGQVTVVPFGVDHGKFQRSPRRGPAGDVIRFCTAKSLTPIYNIPNVVSAFVRLLEQNDEKRVELHIAGDGPEREACISEAGRWLNDRIFLSGRVPHTDMPTFFADKHVLVNVPDSESFGVSVLEASAAELAIIASNAGGLPEVVQHGKTGFLLDDISTIGLQKAMQVFVDHPEKVAAMGSSGRQFAIAEYAWDRCIQGQLQVYNAMIDHSN